MNARLLPDRSPWFTRRNLLGIPPPHTWRARPSLFCAARPAWPAFRKPRFGRFPDLGFTLNPEARRYARPNRVR